MYNALANRRGRMVNKYSQASRQVRAPNQRTCSKASGSTRKLISLSIFTWDDSYGKSAVADRWIYKRDGRSDESSSWRYVGIMIFPICGGGTRRLFFRRCGPLLIVDGVPSRSKHRTRRDARNCRPTASNRMRWWIIGCKQKLWRVFERFVRSATQPIMNMLTNRVSLSMAAPCMSGGGCGSAIIIEACRHSLCRSRI